MNVPHGSSILSCLADMQRHFDLHVAPKLVQKIKKNGKKKKRNPNENVLNGEQSKKLIQPNVQMIPSESIVIKDEPVQEYFEDSTSTNILNSCADKMPVVKQEDPLDIHDENILVENELIRVKVKDEDWITMKNSAKEPTKKKYYCCKYCNKHYKNKGHAARHMKQECLYSEEIRKGTFFHCRKCNAKFSRRYSLEQHNLSMHSNKTAIESCKGCSKEFKYRRDLLRHMKKHCLMCEKFDYLYKCQKCNKKYVSITNLQRHTKKNCDAGESRFHCDHCNFQTHIKGNLPRHLLRAHDIPFAAPRSVCPKCKRSYKNLASLTRHMRGECDKAAFFLCDYCKFKTSRKFTLLGHIRKKHMKVKDKKL